MTAVQVEAFEEGAGNLFTAADLLLALQLIGITAVLLYVAWLSYRAYTDYGDGSISATDLIITWCRGVFVLMLLLYLLRN